MKHTNKIKNFIIGFILGCIFVAGMTYAANEQGLLGGLFTQVGNTEKNGSSYSPKYRLVGRSVQDNTVTTYEIKDGTILGEDLHDGIIKNEHIAENSIKGEDIAGTAIKTGHVNNSFIAPNSKKLQGKGIGMANPIIFGDSEAGFIEKNYNKKHIPTSWRAQKYVHDIWNRVMKIKIDAKSPKPPLCVGKNKYLQWNGNIFTCNVVDFNK